MMPNLKERSVTTIDDDGVTPMSFDAESLPMLMHTMTEMYPDTKMAALRENATNALDSHIEAGQTRPIEVTLPSEADCRLIIQDWGIGMGEYELTKIYGVYGRSTKRRSNKTLGAFGLGSKAALASVDSLQLVTVKDGKRFNVLIAKDVRGVGQLKIIKAEDGRKYTDTNEPNGVKVIIPVKRDTIADFEDKATRLFSLWEDGTVLVNGKRPKTLSESGYRVVSDLGYFATNSVYYTAAAVSVAMGGIIYKVEGLDSSARNAMFKDAAPLKNRDLVVLAEIGDVSVPAPREAILSTPENLRYVKGKIDAMYAYLIANGRAEVEAAPDAVAAVKIASTFGFLQIPNLTYKGVPITENLKVMGGMMAHLWRSQTGRRYIENNAYDKTLYIPVGYNSRTALVFDTRGDVAVEEEFMKRIRAVREMHPDFAVNHRFYVGDWEAMRTEVKEGVMYLDSMVDYKLITVLDAKTETEKALAHRKANRKSAVRTGTRGSLTYPVYTHDGNDYYSYDDMTLAEIRELDSVFVAQIDRYNETSTKTLFRAVGTEGEKMVIVAENRSLESLENRISKDVEVLSFETRANDVLRSQLTPLFANRADVHLDILHNNRSARGLVNNVAPFIKKIDSPLLKKMVKYSPNDVIERRAENIRVRALMRSAGVELTSAEVAEFIEDDAVISETVEAFYKFYKFVIHALSVTIEHEESDVVMFLNALYAAKGDVELPTR